MLLTQFNSDFFFPFFGGGRCWKMGRIKKSSIWCPMVTWSSFYDICM